MPFQEPALYLELYLPKARPCIQKLSPSESNAIYLEAVFFRKPCLVSRSCVLPKAHALYLAVPRPSKAKAPGPAFFRRGMASAMPTKVPTKSLRKGTALAVPQNVRAASASAAEVGFCMGRPRNKADFRG